jgi:hypothetical protein
MTTNMFLERTFDPPLGATEARSGFQRSAWCLEMYRVNWQASFLALSGASMVCWFAAPDAESVRAALNKGGIDARRLWIGTVHEAPVPATPSVLVARSFPSAVKIEDVQAIEDASNGCLQAHRVKFARTFFSSDRTRMLCLYEAPDAESVRLAQREAAMPMETVWAFHRLGPDAPIPRSSR